jgi:hypothetical protein
VRGALAIKHLGAKKRELETDFYCANAPSGVPMTIPLCRKRSTASNAQCVLGTF